MSGKVQRFSIPFFRFQVFLEYRGRRERETMILSPIEGLDPMRSVSTFLNSLSFVSKARLRF